MEKTPAIQQYEAFEVRYPKVVILMQMGDVFESFGENAKNDYCCNS